jgi:hypothetical protein
MEDSQPKHWNRSFERLFVAVFAIVVLVILTLLPAVLPLLILIAGFVVVIALLVWIGTSFWRFFAS